MYVHETDLRSTFDHSGMAINRGIETSTGKKPGHIMSIISELA